MKVFICWSEERSRLVAEALRGWLKGVIQELKPFLSTQDIRSGKRWMSEIAGELAETKFGVLCLTADNLGSPWLHFEAGALSKPIDNNTFVSPYLIGGLTAAEVPDPLGQFQSNTADKEGTRKLIETINAALSDKKLEKEALNVQFEKYWPDLEKVLQNLPKDKGEERAKRSTEDMVEEILDTVRGLAFMMQKREEITPSFFPEISAEELAEYGGKQRALGRNALLDFIEFAERQKKAREDKKAAQEMKRELEEFKKKEKKEAEEP